MQERWNEIKAIWKEFPSMWFIPGLAIGLLIGFLVGASTGGTLDGWFIDSFWPEALGIGITVFAIDRLYESRERKRQVLELKQRLIREMGSPDNATALNALREIGEIENGKWISDGTLRGISLYRSALTNALLKGVYISETNFSSTLLDNADLSESRIERSFFRETILTGSALFRASFISCIFSYAKFDNAHASEIVLQNSTVDFCSLKEIDLFKANLRDCRFFNCDFQNAKFVNADLRGSSLIGSNLEGADIFWEMRKGYWWLAKSEQDIEVITFPVLIDETTWLPDSTKYDPTLGIKQLLRFTNPAHPEFWRSDESNSPAYRLPSATIAETQREDES